MRKSGRKVLGITVALLVSSLLATGKTQAQTTDNAPAHPLFSTESGNTGLWKVFNADNLPPGQASFNVWYDRINRNPGSLTISTVGVSGSVGLTDWLEFGANFEINRHVLARRQSELSFGQQALGLFGNQTAGSPPLPLELIPGSNLIPQLRFPATPTGALSGTAGYYNNLPFAGVPQGNGVGTVTLGLKINILSESKGNPFGFAVRGYGTIPTHRSLNFLLNRPTQTGGWQIGSDLILSKNVGDLAELNLNAGFRGMESPGDSLQVLLSDAVPLGFGFVLPRKTRFQLMSEFTADVFVGSHTPVSTFGARDPVDATMGFRAFLTPSLMLSAGYRRPLNQNVGDMNGFVFDMSYAAGAPEKKVAPTPPSLTCTADPTEVLAGQLVNLSAQAVSSTGRSITYEWSTTGGTLEGSGPTVRLRTDNLTPGVYTATVRATEASGSFADCTTRVTIRTPPPPPQPPTVTCSVDRPRVQVGEIVTITAQARSPQNRPLTYQWSSTGGQVEGSGSSVRFDTTGLRAGSYTVRVRVTDDRNLSAECSVEITVTAPPPPPPPPPPAQVSKLNDCSFRLNSARVDNVCKAKLDDVALRLRNEPDATLAVVGFAASTERNASTLAGSRANNVKTYLVSEKGITDARVQVRSGTPAPGAEMRRVDIHLVPRGATFTGANMPPTPSSSPEQVAKVAEAGGNSVKELAQAKRDPGLDSRPVLPPASRTTNPVVAQKANLNRVVIAKAR